jgi:antitoxin ChpS
MPVSTMRRIGGSVMVAVPPDILRALGTGPQDQVAWHVDGSRAVLTPLSRRPRRKLADLLAQCDPNAPFPKYDEVWTDSRPIGNEAM